MSYDIQLFHILTMHNYENSNDEEFFEHVENFTAFSQDQFDVLKASLLNYDYEVIRIDDDALHFKKSDDESSAVAYLTRYAIYFSASFNQEDSFEISMTASDFTDTGEFAKYDPQLGEWEF
ncbi:hypothetical protein [Acinetobacter sp. WCHAc060025]|uniref:hypothetical protein n=1 Tax=Acinetobacter sp. WCHAc060025 TaxID=2518625 RepID=UPI001023D05D|nr:hypothetical protein [Acinetobacter sp. WCHAc060025]RZG75003.1 hypothetical protein EXE09_11250 [Acinetobacter sp. WCHAc060025]